MSPSEGWPKIGQKMSNDLVFEKKNIKWPLLMFNLGEITKMYGCMRKKSQPRSRPSCSFHSWSLFFFSLTNHYPCLISLLLSLSVSLTLTLLQTLSLPLPLFNAVGHVEAAHVDSLCQRRCRGRKTSRFINWKTCIGFLWEMFDNQNLLGILE